MKLVVNIALLLVLLSIFWFLNLRWLFILIIPFYLLVAIWKSNIFFIKWAKQNFLARTIAQFLFLFLLVITLRVFVFEMATIPSSSMEKTLFPSDKIIINQLAYGARVPRDLGDLPWLHVLHGYIGGAKRPIENRTPPYRLKGYSSVQRNDVLIFTLPNDFEILATKRCIGLPGDIISVIDQKVFINKQLLPPPPRSIPEKAEQKKSLTNEKGMYVLPSANGKGVYFLDLTYRDSLGWDYNNFGPIIIPKKGMAIALTKDNKAIYGKILETFENQFWLTNQEPTVEVSKKDRHVFKHDYYFLLGDNRGNSIDSRFWGLVPEYLIKGKTNFVLWSSNKGRYFKKID